jgi:hypothetical protein
MVEGDACEQLVEPSRSRERVAVPRWGERDAATEHALQDGSTLRGALAEQPSPLRQPVLHHLWGEARDGVQTAKLSGDGLHSLLHRTDFGHERRRLATGLDRCDEPSQPLLNVRPFAFEGGLVVRHVVALGEPNHLLDGLRCQRVFLDGVQHGFIQRLDCDFERVATRAIGPMAIADVLRVSAALVPTGLHDEPAATHAAGRQPSEQILRGVLGWTAAEQTRVEP